MECKPFTQDNIIEDYLMIKYIVENKEKTIQRLWMLCTKSG